VKQVQAKQVQAKQVQEKQVEPKFYYNIIINIIVKLTFQRLFVLVQPFSKRLGKGWFAIFFVKVYVYI